MVTTVNGAASEYVASLFKGEFEDNVATLSVGTSQEQLIKPDSERVFLLVVNLSVNAMYLGFDEQVSSSRGIKLSPNGGFIIYNARDDFILPTRGFHIVADVAASTAYFLSMKRFRRVDN